MSDLRFSIIDLNRVKHLKDIYKQRNVSVAWHHAKWWDWCMPEDDKKGVETTFTDKNYYKFHGKW